VAGRARAVDMHFSITVLSLIPYQNTSHSLSRRCPSDLAKYHGFTGLEARERQYLFCVTEIKSPSLYINYIFQRYMDGLSLVTHDHKSSESPPPRTFSSTANLSKYGRSPVASCLVRIATAYVQCYYIIHHMVCCGFENIHH
jgi:hypothetical protein